MRCAVAVAGPTAPTSTDQRRRSTTASCAGLRAASGSASSARSQVMTTCRTGCSSTAAASRSTAVRGRRKRGDLAHGIGRTKGGRNTKIHAICDARGRPHVLLLTPGNVHDSKAARLCIEALPPSAKLVAEKGYDSQALRDWLERAGHGARHPAAQEPQGHRAHVLPPERLASPGHQVRPQHQELHGCCCSRRRRHLVAVMGPDSSRRCSPAS